MNHSPLRSCEPNLTAHQQQQSANDDLANLLYTVSKEFSAQRDSAIAARYLEQRGLEPGTIRRFEIGYCPSGIRPLLTESPNPKRRELLLEAGLIAVHDNRDYNPWAGRLMLPIRALDNRLVGFGARALGETTPRYRNSPESSLFRKRELLFGLPQARQSIKTLKHAIVVEGYFDAMLMHQIGLRQTVATLGSSFNRQQLEQLQDCGARTVTLMFDSDAAGQSAALRSLETLLPAAANSPLLAIARPPEPHKDSAAAVEAGDHESVRVALERAQSVWTFLRESLCRQPDTLERTLRVVQRCLAQGPDQTDPNSQTLWATARVAFDWTDENRAGDDRTKSD